MIILVSFYSFQLYNEEILDLMDTTRDAETKVNLRKHKEEPDSRSKGLRV